MGQDTGVFGEYALQYYNLGMNVLPVHDREPVKRGWDKLFYVRQTELEVIEDIERYGDKNGIAMVCGKYGTVLDIDDKDPRPDLHALAPRTPMKRFGSKGLGYLYIGNDQPKRMSRNHPIELFGYGYVVLPPSYHPGNQAHYKWTDDTTFVPMNELPPHTDEHWNALVDYCQRHQIMRTGTSRVRDGSLADEMASNVSAGRNNTLLHAAWRILHNAEHARKPTAELVDMIMAIDRELHPHNPWFEDPTERKSLSPRLFAEKLINRSITKKLRDSGVVIVPSAEWKEVVDAPPVVKKQKPVSHFIPKVPLIPRGGLIEAVHDNVSAINGQDSPLFSLAAALSLSSILAGHRITVGRTHPNIFVLTLAESGSGKQAPQDVVTSALMNTVTGHSLIGASDYSSHQGAINGLVSQRRRLDIIDECSIIFDEVNQKDVHRAGFADELSKIFSKSHTILPAKLAAKKENSRPAMANPYLSIMGFSTRSAFYDYYTNLLVERGFGGRCLFFADSAGQRIRRRGIYGLTSDDGNQRKCQWSQEIVDHMNEWLTMDIAYTDEQGRKAEYMLGGGIPQTHTVKVSKEATALLMKWQDEYDDQASGAEQRGDTNFHFKANLNRAIEMHLRLLGCWVVSQVHPRVVEAGLELGVEQVTWAHEIFELSMHSLRLLTAEAAANNTYSVIIRKYRAIAAGGRSEWSAKRFNEWLRRNTSSQREAADIVTMLTNSEYGWYAVSDKVSSNGKRKKNWVFNPEMPQETDEE